MSDTVSPATVVTAIAALLSLVGTVIASLMLRGNTRLTARLQQEADEARRSQAQEDSDRAARLAREQQLDTQTQWLLAQYRQDIEELRKQLDAVKRDYQQRLDALHAENADLRRRIIELEHIQRAGGGTAAAS